MPDSSAPPTDDASRPWPLGLAAALVVLAAGLAYANSLAGVFVYDDFNSIVQNPTIRSLWPPWAASWAPVETTPGGRPLFNLTLAINYAISGLHPWSYHLLSIVIHALAGLALLGVLRHTLAGPRIQPRLGPRSADVALAISLLWVVHPLHSHAVAYTAQRSEALMGLFFLLTFYCAIRAWQAPGWRWPVLAVVFCILGTGSKQIMAAAPPLVVAYDLVFHPAPVRAVIRRRWRLWAGLALCWPIVIALASARPRVMSVGIGLDGVGAFDYLLTQFEVLVHYGRLTFWPAPLCFDYGWPIAEGLGQVWPQALLVIGAGVASAIALLRRNPWGFVGAWFFVILAPTSSVLPIVTEVAAEHRMYLPAAGLLAALGVLAARGLRRLAHRIGRPRALRWAAGLIVGAATAGLTYQTARTNKLYHDEIALWRDVVAKRPRNYVAHHSLGHALERYGQPRAAEEHYRRAIEIRPDYSTALNNLATMKTAAGDLEAAERLLLRALERWPDYGEAWSNLAAVRRRRGDIDGAVAALEHSLEDETSEHRGDCAYNLGMALLVRSQPGDRQRAVAALERAVELAVDPDPDAHFQLGRLLLKLGRRTAAARHLRRSLALDPDRAEARRLLQALETPSP